MPAKFASAHPSRALSQTPCTALVRPDAGIGLVRDSQKRAPLGQHAKHFGILLVPQRLAHAVGVRGGFVATRAQRQAGDVQDHPASAVDPVENLTKARRPPSLRRVVSQHRTAKGRLVNLSPMEQSGRRGRIALRSAALECILEKRVVVEARVSDRHEQKGLAIGVKQIIVRDPVAAPLDF